MHVQYQCCYFVTFVVVLLLVLVFFFYLCLRVLCFQVLSSIHSQDGWNPLMIASFKGHVAIVKLLIKAKAQLNTQLEVHCQNTTHLISTTICSVTYCEYCFCPQSGATALHLAVQEDEVEVVRLLVEAKSLVNLQKKVVCNDCHSSLHDGGRSVCEWSYTCTRIFNVAEDYYEKSLSLTLKPSHCC